MRKFTALALLLPALAFSATWSASTDEMDSFSSAQNLTGSAPTLVTEGINLLGPQQCMYTVCAQSGATILGGSVQGFYYVPYAGLWSRAAGLDFTVTTGARCASSSAFPLFSRVGRIDLMPNGVTVSAGTQVTIYLRCSYRAQ